MRVIFIHHSCFLVEVDDKVLIFDYFDGYLARQRNETSAFGRLLDPIADKLLVASALVVILAKHMVCFEVSFVPVIVILCREILVSGLREFLREVNVGMPVTRLAKWKTGFQMAALGMIFFNGWWIWGGLGELLLWVAGCLTFVTGYQYFQKSMEYINAENDAKKVAKAEDKVVADASKKAPSKKAASKKVTSKTSK